MFEPEVGHPLIPKGRVDNDFDMGRNKVLLVTGSNMSGKAFLRTVGLNCLLMLVRLHVQRLFLFCHECYTCMRISDNLKNISGFYAELLRIKMT